MASAARQSQSKTAATVKPKAKFTRPTREQDREDFRMAHSTARAAVTEWSRPDTMDPTTHKVMPMIATSTQVTSRESVRIEETVRCRTLTFQRHRAASPFDRLAQELGYARAKTARDNVAVAYRRVAITNRIFLEHGMSEKVGELMAVVEASLMGEVPPLADAIHQAQCADAVEDRYEADFIHNSGDAELEQWIKKLAAELHSGEVLLKALITERDHRQAAR